ncbi:MAG: oligosaccharide flippase family protein [Actinomycetes bacterium]
MGNGRKPKSQGYSLLLKDSVIYGAGRALQKFLVALLLPLYTAFLSPGDYGILGMVVTVTTFLDVFITMGFDVAFSRFYFDDKSPQARSRVITNVFYVSTVYPLILLGVLGVLMPRLAPLLLGEQYDSGDWRYFAVALATLFFSNLNDLPFTLFRLEHRPWIFSAYTIGRVLVQVPLSILFVAVFKWGPMGVLAANFVTAAGMQCGLLPTYIRKIDWGWHWHLMRPMLAFAVPALFTGISFYWLKLSDRFFLLHYQGKAEVGLYTVANSLAQPLFLMLMAFRMAWPQWHYAKLHEPAKHKRMVARSSTYFITLNGAVLVLLGAFLPLLVHVFLNRKFWSVGPVTFVLGLSIVLYALYFIFWVGANVAKRNRMIPVFFAIASAANIGLNFWLIPQYGMWAAAWTTVAGYLILAVTVYFYSQKWYPIPYEWARLLKVLLATVVALAVAWGIGRALGMSVYAPLNELALDTLATAPAVLLFPLVLWATRFFTPGERRKLAGAARRLTGRPAAQVTAAGAAGSAGALAVAAGTAADAGAAGMAPAEPCDHACVDELSEDDLAAEDEELEMEQEADIDLTEGPTGTTIT